MSHQKDLNKRMMAGLGKQKEQIKRLKVLVGDADVGSKFNFYGNSRKNFDKILEKRPET